MRLQDAAVLKGWLGFHHHSEMGVLVEAHDWSATPLGPIEGWPQSLRTAVDLMLGSRQPVYIAWGPELTSLYNDGYIPIVGAKHPAGLGKPFDELWAEIRDEYRPLVEAVMAGEALHFVDRPAALAGRDGIEIGYFTFSWTPLRDEEGVIRGFFCNGLETTSRVETDRAFRRAFEASPTPLLVLAPDAPRFTIRHVNDAYLAAAMRTREELVGAAILEAFPDNPSDANATGVANLRASLERVLASRQPDVMPVQKYDIARPDGTFEARWWQPANSPVVGEAGIEAIIHHVVDVTEQHRTQVQLRDLNETLETRVAERTAELVQAQEALRQSQKLEAMGQLTGGVSHDFNNLLSPIIGALDLLQRKQVGGDREQRLIEGALASAEKARVLVQRLLAFARRQPLQPTPVDIGQVIRNMADLISSTTGPRVRVAVDAPDDLPAALADANQLEMAILNLAVNARDAMPDGGQITISARAAAVGGADHGPLAPGRYVQLSVADTGTGMDEATLARAVEPFFSTKGVGRGTGLGLSMVHGLTAQLGGALRLSSTPGLGTNVELWLPAAESEADTPRQSAVAAPPQGAGTALLVDDEDLVRTSTADMLADLGYKLAEAGSAEEALRLIECGLDFDVLVTDHLMPGMTGTELAREVRRRRPGAGVLVISGYAEVEGIAVDLPRLVKPFRQADLATCVADAISRSNTG